MIWTGTTNTMTVYGSEPNEYNGMPVGERIYLDDMESLY